MDATCYATDTPVDIYFVREAIRKRLLVEREDFESILQDEINLALLDGSLQVPGLVDVSGVTTAQPGGTGTAGVQEDITQINDDDSGIGPGGIIVASAAAALVVVVLLLCLATRRRRSQGPGTSSFREVHDEFIEEDTSKVHILGDEESIASVWAPWKKQDEFSKQKQDEFSQLGNLAETTNVHRCNSFTCELCEAERNNNVTFVPAGSVFSPPPRLPNNAEREYMATDSVIL